MGIAEQHDACARIVLVPGLLSPSWMMYPLAVYLRRRYPSVERWDYPYVLRDPAETIAALAAKIDAEPETPLTLVAHSFGDWIARQAIAACGRVEPVRLVSICPVIEPPPLARLAAPLFGRMAPELAIMADPTRCRVPLPTSPATQCVWISARWEWLLRRAPPPDGVDHHITVRGTHNSVLFQPNGWRAVGDAIAGRRNG